MMTKMGGKNYEKCCLTFLLFYCFVLLLSCSGFLLLCCCLVVLLCCCLVVLLCCCLVVLLSCSLVLLLFYCLAVLLSCSLVSFFVFLVFFAFPLPILFTIQNNDEVVTKAHDVLAILWKADELTQENFGDDSLDEALDSVQENIFDDSAPLRRAAARFTAVQYEELIADSAGGDDGEDDEVDDTEHPNDKMERHSLQLGVLLNIIENRAHSAPSYVPHLVDGFWNIEGTECLRDVHTQMKLLLLDDENEIESLDELEKDQTMKIFILEECTLRQVGLGGFPDEIIVRKRKKYLSDRTSKRMLEHLPKLLSKFSDTGLRVRVLAGLVPHIDPDVLGAVGNGTQFHALLKQLCTLYLQFGSVTCIDTMYRQTMTGALGSLGAVSDDEDDDDDDDDMNEEERAATRSTNRDLSLQEQLVANDASANNIVEKLAMALSHLCTFLIEYALSHNI